jgi:hypothetical protein
MTTEAMTLTAESQLSVPAGPLRACLAKVDPRLVLVAATASLPGTSDRASAGCPSGIGGADRLENVVRSRRQQAMDELSPGGMSPEEGLGPSRQPRRAEQSKDAAGDRQRPGFSRANRSVSAST